MIQAPTVLILGAGASIPFGFPSGRALKGSICINLSKRGNEYGELLKTGFNDNLIKEFADSLRYSGANSVDAFLEHRTEFIEVGKVAIAQELLPFEITKNLFDLNLYDLNKETWYDYLFRKLNAKFEDFHKNELSIITFNYDRSIEQYLFVALSNLYGRNREECAKTLDEIPIIHLYGKLGALPLENDVGIPFDVRTPNIEQLKIASECIKIVSEEVVDDYEFKLARKLLNKAQQIYFIGFGYDKTNLDRLLKGTSLQNKNISGTAYGLSKMEQHDVMGYFSNNSFRIKLKPIDAYEFIRDVHLI